MFKTLEKHEYVLGTRYGKEFAVDKDWPWYRVIISKGIEFAGWLRLWTHAADARVLHVLGSIPGAVRNTRLHTFVLDVALQGHA